MKDQIHYHTQCHKPASLSQAYWFAKRLEQATPNFRKFSTSTSQNKQPKTEPAEGKDNKLPAPILAEVKVAGKCFKCREPWILGHAKVCKSKQSYYVILVENAEGKEEELEITKTCKISVQALTGTPSTRGTFTLKLQINGNLATAPLMMWRQYK